MQSRPACPNRYSSSADACPGTSTVPTQSGWSGSRPALVEWCGHPGRPGVRHAHRDRQHADGQPDREPVDQLTDGADEPLPVHVRLGSGHQQEGLARAVVHEVDDQLRLAVAGEPVAGEREGGPARAVVDERIGVESGHHRVVERAQEMVDRQSDPGTGVDVAVERVHQHRFAQLVQLRDLEMQFVQLARFNGHDSTLPAPAFAPVTVPWCTRGGPVRSGPAGIPSRRPPCGGRRGTPGPPGAGRGLWPARPSRCAGPSGRARPPNRRGRCG